MCTYTYMYMHVCIYVCVFIRGHSTWGDSAPPKSQALCNKNSNTSHGKFSFVIVGQRKQDGLFPLPLIPFQNLKVRPYYCSRLIHQTQAWGNRAGTDLEGSSLRTVAHSIGKF